MAGPAARPPLRKDGAFALFWVARTVSWLGSGISAVVLPVLVYQRTGTAGRMLGWGGYPLGALAGGALAEVLPIRVTLLVMALPRGCRVRAWLPPAQRRPLMSVCGACPFTRPGDGTRPLSGILC